MRTVALPGKSPLVTFRIVFTTGAAADPADKPGLAYLTAQMLADGGTKDLTYKQIVDAMFPMAAGVSAQADKEMTHVRRRHARGQSGRLLQADARHAARRRAGARTISGASRTTPSTPSRSACAATTTRNWARKCCTRRIYAGHAVRALQRRHGVVAGEDDARRSEGVLQERTTRSRNLIIGIAGGYPPEFLDAMKKDFAALPADGGSAARACRRPRPIEQIARRDRGKGHASVAYSLGYPDRREARRSGLSRRCCWCESYLGQHRMSSGGSTTACARCAA